MHFIYGPFVEKTMFRFFKDCVLTKLLAKHPEDANIIIIRKEY